MYTKRRKSARGPPPPPNLVLYMYYCILCSARQGLGQRLLCAGTGRARSCLPLGLRDAFSTTPVTLYIRRRDCDSQVRLYTYIQSNEAAAAAVSMAACVLQLRRSAVFHRSESSKSLEF